MFRFAHHIGKLILLLTALQILNLDLFYQDVDTSGMTHPGDNYINSITEYFAECVYHIANAFPENQNESSPLSHKQHDLKVQSFKILNDEGFFQFWQSVASASFVIERDQRLYHQFTKEINPPPPKV